MRLCSTTSTELNVFDCKTMLKFNYKETRATYGATSKLKNEKTKQLLLISFWYLYWRFLVANFKSRLGYSVSKCLLKVSNKDRATSMSIVVMSRLSL